MARCTRSEITCLHASAMSFLETTSPTGDESSSESSSCAALASFSRNRCNPISLSLFVAFLMSDFFPSFGLLKNVYLQEHEPWCNRYMELYQELRENWERLYWDEGYSKKIARDHANYDSAEDDDQDFNPYRYTDSWTRFFDTASYISLRHYWFYLIHNSHNIGEK